MVEKIGALADDAARTVAHRLESGLAGLLDQLLCDLGPTAGEQVRSARVVAFLDAVEGIVEAADFRRIRLAPCRNAGEYRFNSGVVPYQGSHVPSSIPRLVTYRPGWSGGLPLAVGCYCDRKTAPVEGPRRITRARWSEEPVVARRLGGSAEMLLDRGSIVWLLFHTHV